MRTRAESAWNFYCALAVADFFRAMRMINAGDWMGASTSLWFSDMTDRPFSLEMLDDEQVEKQMGRLEYWESQLESHAIPKPEPMDDTPSFVGGQAPVDDLVPVPVPDTKPHSSYLDHL